MNPRFGVCLYTIELDGCLNGLFTNEGAGGEIFNEICKKRSDDPHQDSLIGTYDIVYFDVDRQNHTGTLTIDPHRDFQNVFNFQWQNSNGNNEFAGIGYLISPRQVVVRYEGAM